jgi:L-lactate dehydrogenase complex protein LldF
LNVCPVYARTGGHAYGSVYPGPIGAILTPQLVGIENAKSLPFASSLCGACYEVCPVKIDIPKVLLHLRAQAGKGRAERLAMRLAAWGFGTSKRFAFGTRLARLVQRPAERIGLLAPWTRTRDLKPVARQSFRDWWHDNRA